MDIPRSPYTFTMENDSMTLTLRTEEMGSGVINWPIYEVDGKYYLQEKFILEVPKGVSVLKVTTPYYLGMPICKCIVIDEDTDVVWFKNALNSTPVYSYIGVTTNRAYNLKVDEMTSINAEKGYLTFEYSYKINNTEPTQEDYIDD